MQGTEATELTLGIRTLTFTFASRTLQSQNSFSSLPGFRVKIKNEITRGPRVTPRFREANSSDPHDLCRLTVITYGSPPSLSSGTRTARMSGNEWNARERVSSETLNPLPIDAFSALPVPSTAATSLRKPHGDTGNVCLDYGDDFIEAALGTRNKA